MVLAIGLWRNGREDTSKLIDVGGPGRAQNGCFDASGVGIA